MELPDTSTALAGAVQELASQVASALRSGDHLRVLGRVVSVEGPGRDDVALAAVRVLGADALLPSVLLGRPVTPEDRAVFQQAASSFPPAAGARPASLWSHWAMRRTLGEDGTEPGTRWLDAAPWQVLTRQLAVLAALAVPGADCGVGRLAADRPVDVARGFVRAVRRRDWLQAAGAGRWLSLIDDVPESLGLAEGLEFVNLMAGDDPRVALQLRAAQLLRTGALV
ncbi:hypothetical protein [Streptomyces syringium]|uniref:hypothetical protein n=1 Tax=Streptomyces syringium TaxID=76729 RepID=UPI00342EDB43